MHKAINIKSIMTDIILLCLKMLMYSQQHLCAVNFILKSKENQPLNLMSPLIFNEVEHIEINVIKINNVILFHILYIVEIKHEFINTVTVKHNIKSIVNEISVNYNLKNAVKIIIKSFYIEFLINFVKMLVIYVKLLFKFESDAVKNQLMKEFRQNNESVLTSLKKQSGDILTIDLIQQCFTHHIYKSDFV